VIKFIPAAHYFEALIVAAKQIWIGGGQKEDFASPRAMPKHTAPLL
jgi:hypothetical protein